MPRDVSLRKKIRINEVKADAIAIQLMKDFESTIRHDYNKMSYIDFV